MKSHLLMQLLIPDLKVSEVFQFTGLKPSVLYHERRESGKDAHTTGKRNTIDRLDLFCEFALNENPEAVRIVGERYLQMYEHHMSEPIEDVTVSDLLKVLGEASRESGEAIACLGEQASVSACTVEIAQAKAKFELALRYLRALEEQNVPKSRR